MATDSQSNFVKLIENNENASHLRLAINRWKNGYSSPSLVTVDEVCDLCNIEVYFCDNTIESVIRFNEIMGKKLGFNTKITIEK